MPNQIAPSILVQSPVLVGAQHAPSGHTHAHADSERAPSPRSCAEYRAGESVEIKSTGHTSAMGSYVV